MDFVTLKKGVSAFPGDLISNDQSFFLIGCVIGRDVFGDFCEFSDELQDFVCVSPGVLTFSECSHYFKI